VIVEFGDFQCPFCREAAPIMKEVLRRYPEAVRLIYRDFPVASIHTQAVAAAEAANCAARQKADSFWKFHDALYENQDQLGAEFYLALAGSLGLDRDKFQSCLEQHLTLAEIHDDYTSGLEAGVQGTPTWFINGHKAEGALSLELWDQVIVSVLKNEFSR
ncbi:MAG: DsbA family protein, partial [Candidatus Veblenbacteria bacterium]|nr:DsbA family protein [Candidatus Veblenbacteria bacterium]